MITLPALLDQELAKQGVDSSGLGRMTWSSPLPGFAA